MNPILLRYGAFLLAAVIAGAGGGYLAVNKKASPPAVTQSGTIPAVPAQPLYPGAIPAIPAVPDDHPRPQIGVAPILSSLLKDKCSEYRTTPADAYCLTAYWVLPSSGWSWSEWFHDIRRFARGPLPNPQYNVLGDMTALGYEFTKADNEIKWDGKIIQRILSEDDGTKLTFKVPENQELCSVHDVSVQTRFGMSNSLKVKFIEPLPGGWIWMLPQAEPISGPIGKEIKLRFLPYDHTTDYFADLIKKGLVKAEYYAVFTTNEYPPNKSYVSGVATTPLAVVKPPDESGLGESGIYSLKIPAEINKCPTTLYKSCADNQVLAKSAADQMIPIKPATYGIHVVGVYKGVQCGTTLSNSNWVDSQRVIVTEK